MKRTGLDIGLAAFAVIALLYGAVSVQAGPAADQISLLEAQVQTQGQRITSLEGRVTALEVLPSATPAPSPVATPTPTVSPSPSPTNTPTPAPTATPTPTPTPSPSPLPTPIATPSPTSSTDPWAVAFASRPSSPAISLSGTACQGTAAAPIVIENLTFSNTPAGRSAIVLNGCKFVTIRAVDFLNVPGGVYAVNSSNVTLQDARYQNITGPSVRTGANVGNLIQTNGVTTCLIKHNKGKGGDTEDIVSIYKSSGCVVEGNQFEGTNWTSNSGSGIALCDSGGTNNIARSNTVLNPGQVGIFIAGGTGCQIVNNTIIGQQRAGSNVGMYVWNQSGAACSGHTVSGNVVQWTNASGSANPFWNAGNCGAVAGSGNTLGGAPANVEQYRVSL